jgi:hypothetical protein
MDYYVDFEFTRFEGEIISVGIVSETGKELYLALSDEVLEEERKARMIDPWVVKNVIPLIDSPGAEAERFDRRLDIKQVWPLRIYQYMLDTQNHVRMPATFITDWWEDVKLMSGLMITGPGTCINVPHGTFVVTRADTYPTTLEGAVQHNALWDARVLKHELGRFRERY